jgi:ferritin-like metal-binding protein YciE
MKNSPKKSNGSREEAKATSSPNGIHSSQLFKLFEDELKDIYWAEKALTKAIPKMIKKATSDELIDALTAHLAETEEQVKRVEQVFESVNKKPVAKKCEAMTGLLKEAEEIMESCEAGAMCDAGIIAAGQKVEHYEIASYGTLRQFAETLELTEVAELLEKNLQEEKAANKKLSEVAMRVVNAAAAKLEEIEQS